MYEKYTQREIKNLVKHGLAEDVTNYDFERMAELLQSINKSVIGTSHGKYGVNGAVFKDETTGDVYAITARNSGLMMVV